MRVYLALSTTVVLWASAFVGIRAAVAVLPPGELAFMRYAVASIVMAVIVLLTRPRRPPRHAWPRIAAIALTGIAGYNLALNLGEQTVTAGAASLLSATNPLITTVLAVALLGERISSRLVLALSLGFAGAALIAVAEGDAMSFDPGALLVLAAAAALSTSFVLQKPIVAEHGPFIITACAIWVGTLALSPFAATSVAALRTTPPETLAAVLYLGVAPGATAYALWAYVLSRMPASRAANYLYGGPVAAILIAWVWLEEFPEPLVIAGGLIAVLGVLVGTTSGLSASSRFNRFRPPQHPDDSRETIE
jgi:drug/metabolite transporter (DMT)-like permease